MKFTNLMVTGGCGFIGSNFIRYLVEEIDFKGRIINVDSLTYAGNPLSLRDIEQMHPNRYLFEKADICDSEKIQDIFNRYNVDAVCHFAAESHVDRSIKRPDNFIFTNIVGTFNLLECARAASSDFIHFHHISTDEVYGSLGPTGFFTEETPYRPNSPYSASKASSDHLVRAYHETYGLPTTISNCSNNYGPYQFPEKLIPLSIMNALEARPLPIYGDGKNVRDWLYVRDHCDAIWKIINSGNYGETYNIGGNSEIENIVIVEMICNILDEVIPPSNKQPRKNLITFVKDRPGHDRRYAIDFSKMRETFTWKPQESFATGLRKTITWYLENQTWINDVRSGAYQAWIKEQYMS
ncbi:MAG: dTDP-glucose 4,6-dehydratase [Proteobacteria bacterium]|nr:dTDP-glucose 4,6-dehydratase [Pseudomonadota bacterium]